MAYTKDDPRSALATATRAPAETAGGDIAAPQFLDFSVLPPDVTTADGSHQWITRGQNFVMIYTEPAAGDLVWRARLDSEQVVLLIDERSSVRGTDDDGVVHEATGPALLVVPPGQSSLTSTGTGPIVQLLQSDEAEWAAKASNAAAYAEPHPHVAPLELWPEPVGGYRWRSYSMSDVPADPKRFGRIFRTRAFMVNFMPPSSGPRDLTRMSPHFHDDFEQASLVVAGTYIHHIQTPWGTDGTKWRPEDHVRVGSPSVTIIPPPTVHTSQAIGWRTNHLIDIFSGPRHDFSARPGWVLNADEYPAPTD
ncbi:hypothetical protein [Pseudonocardia thermophila]|jgi:hypothetical protein|uniref:hypothetical protein n=1 Tax=Pseudonocardia thermophila TaxID=1848 RepID=UPI00248DF1A6|nr:hypothetical protein [Pseudonocardia thermophila]